MGCGENPANHDEQRPFMYFKVESATAGKHFNWDPEKIRVTKISETGGVSLSSSSRSDASSAYIRGGKCLVISENALFYYSYDEEEESVGIQHIKDPNSAQLSILKAVKEECFSEMMRSVREGQGTPSFKKIENLIQQNQNSQ